MKSVPHLRHLVLGLWIICSLGTDLASQGKVYIVYGSDTAIWEGMSVSRYECTYKTDLYINPSRNAYAVMDPSYRNAIRDSDGNPVKFTWWMMAGNIFRYATNTDVPVPNVMTMHLMKKYHGDAIRQFGDELTLHYHTFVWTDYNRDGVFYWNQALDFNESRDDFYYTLAQFLVEESVFPVSFRSGWHAMDNRWQATLDSLLPYSLHNDYPAKRVDLVEPLDNTFDWSLSSSEFVPYKPSPHNYQLPGNGRGWNVRSKHIGNFNATLAESIFSSAAAGKDQVVCLWGHLPETDFLTNIQMDHTLLLAAQAKYPAVTFHYLTAVEAMQRWRKGTDTIPPLLTLTEEDVAGGTVLRIVTNEEIFQFHPFVAAKDLEGGYHVLECVQLAPREWRTKVPYSRENYLTLSIALSDTMGNQAIHHIRRAGADIFIDDETVGYLELGGMWQNSTNPAWGATARSASIPQGDSAVVRWQADIPPPTGITQPKRACYLQVPAVSNPADSVRIRILNNMQVMSDQWFTSPLVSGRWIYLGYHDFTAGTATVELTAYAGSGSKNIAVDVVKITPHIRSIVINTKSRHYGLGLVSAGDTVNFVLPVFNNGIKTLVLQSLTATGGRLVLRDQLPLQIQAGDSYDLRFYYFPKDTGVNVDTILIANNDPLQSIFTVHVSADIRPHIAVIDNEDPAQYRESGVWSTSVATAYGRTSRFAPLNQNPGAYADFSATLKKSGVYKVRIIVPTTVNASNRAKYSLISGGKTLTAFYLDQNTGSGGWRQIGSWRLQANTTYTIRVEDDRTSTGGTVLRADAVMFDLAVEEPTSIAEDGASTPKEFALYQNYPNPFNPSTRIRFDLPAEALVTAKIFDITGRVVKQYRTVRYQAGSHELEWDASGIGSGMYFLRFEAAGSPASHTKTIKMLLMR